MSQPVQTITIDNFKGALAREIHGDINSGFIPFLSTFGGVYPFANVSYPSQLEFIEDASTIDISTFGGPVLYWAGSSYPSSTDPAVFGVGITGSFHVARVSLTSVPTADYDTVGTFVKNVSSTATLYYGGGMGIFQMSGDGTAVAYVGLDWGLRKSSNLNLLNATWTDVGAPTSSSWVLNVPRPMVQFGAFLYVGNGNNIAEITDGTSITATAKFSPGLPANYVIRDIRNSNDGRYLIGIASFVNDPNDSLRVDGTAGTLGNPQLFNTFDSVVFTWNGTDLAMSSIQLFRGINLSSIIVSNTETLLFGKDDEGIGLWDLGGNKIYSIPDFSNINSGYPPSPGHVYTLGKKIFFEIQLGNVIYLFCLDRNDNSLYCLYKTAINKEAVKGGVIIPSTHSYSIPATADLTRSKIYFSFGLVPTTTSTNNKLFSQHLQHYGGTLFAGTYSTQIQKFAKKISIKEVRVFTQPTAANDSFSVALLGSNCLAYTNGTFTYTYSAGTDATLGQGSLDLIKFYPQMKDVQSLGVQINQLGGAPVINKIEIDYTYSDIPKTSN